MGGYRTVNYVQKRLNPNVLSSIIDFEAEEKKWFKLDQKIDYEFIKSYEKFFGLDYLGRLITSDRRLGNGYVSGGLVRPNSIVELVKKNTDVIPFTYAQGALKFMEELFSSKTHDLVFLYAVAGAPAVLLSYFANYKKVELIRFQHTRIQNRVLLDSSFMGSLSELKTKYFDEKTAINEKAKKKATDYLEVFRKKPIIPEYSKFNSTKRLFVGKKLVLFIIYFFAYYFKFLLPFKYKSLLTKDKLNHKRFYFLHAIKTTFIKNNFDNEIPFQKYVYFPLHVDPEASTMVMSPMHTNQFAVIENLSKSLPSDHVLVVKEHIPMLGFRPKGFYEKIKALPRVKLVQPTFDQFSLIKNASVIAVITGTAGFEGLMLKKKVLLISENAPFSFFKKGLIVESDLSRFGESFLKLTKIDPLDDTALIRYLSLIFQETIPMNSEILWGNYSSLKKDIKQRVLSDISSQLTKVLHRDKNIKSNN